MKAAPPVQGAFHAAPASVPLAIVTGQFPEPNETFIVREIAALVRRGFAITIFSLLPPPAVILDPEARALLPLAVYPPRGVAGVVAAAWRTVRRDPRAAWRAVRRGLRDAVAALPTPGLAAKQLALLPLALAYGGRLPDPPCRLHAHFASLPTAVVRVLAALRATRYSFTAHAYDIHARGHRRQLPARIGDADRVVTCTAFNRDVLASLAPGDDGAAKIALCHHGLELPAYAPGRARRPGLIVGGASLHPKKGLHHLVEACARLAARGVSFQCLLVGEGPERARLEAQIASHGLGDRVRLTGRLAHREMIAHLREAVVLAHPSIVDRRGSMDGIPNTILEAFAVETPVVASRLSGIPEVVLPDRTGLLVEPGDVEALAAALERVLGDPILAHRLGAAGRALVLEGFDIGRNVERLAGLLGG